MSKTLTENQSLLNSLGYFLRTYGLSNTIKLILCRGYKRIKQNRLDLTEEHVISVNGYNMKTLPHDIGISAELIMFGTHEPLTTKLIRNSISKGMVCLDLGSNIGYYALLEAQLVGEEGRVFAFEPSPLNFNLLKNNLDLENRSNIEIQNFALTNKNGTLSFLIPKKSNYCRVVKDGEKISSADKIIDVPSRTLDSFLIDKSLDKIDFMRMDVEGYEYHIYQGMRETIKKHRPTLLMEFHKSNMGIEQSKQFLKELENDGYCLQYYIDRALDEALLAKDEFIISMSLKELYSKLENNFLSSVFTLFFINKTK